MKRKKRMAKKEEKVLTILDAEWDNYVMSLFDSSELVDGHPNVAGLRRVARLVLGEIYDSRPTAVFVTGENRATVVYEVKIRKEDGKEIVFGDVADSSEYNADVPFCLHPSAMASTRAEARALRKALCLKKASSEELNGKNAPRAIELKVKVENATNGEVNPDSLISDSQKNYIASLCSKIGSSVPDLLEELKGSQDKPWKVENIDEFTKEQASSFIDFLKKRPKEDKGA